MADIGVASRSAAALFAVAVRQNELQTAEEDLQAVNAIWGENSQIDETMAHPRIPTPTKRRILQQLMEGRARPLVLNFLLLLLDKQRIALLPEIGKEFERLADAHRGIERAYVTTAVPLAADQAEALRARLSQQTGKVVQLVPQIDPRIMGGVIVRIGDRLWDGSIRGYLSELRLRLAGDRF